MFTLKRRSDKDAVAKVLGESITELRVACGLLVTGQRSGAHAGCTGWLEDLERALARMQLVHQQIKESQGWRSRQTDDAQR
jgi:hypothetical protein